MPPEMMTAAKVAEALGVSARTVLRMADDGRLSPAMKLDGYTGANLWRRADVDAYKAELEAAS